MIYSEKGHVLFTHISRTGGTTIDNCMRRLLPDSRTIVGQHAPLFSARALLGERFEQVYKFAFVRNPWDRFVSWYALIARAKYGDDSTHAALIDPHAAHWQGFDAFLETWCAQQTSIAGVRHRSLSQWAQLVDADGVLLTDDLGRFETYAEDATRLLAKANLYTGEIQKINTSQHLHYSVYYSAFGRELIADAFPEDVGNLGYQFKPEVFPAHTSDTILGLNASEKPHSPPSFSRQKRE